MSPSRRRTLEGMVSAALVATVALWLPTDTPQLWGLSQVACVIMAVGMFSLDHAIYGWDEQPEC